MKEGKFIEIELPKDYDFLLRRAEKEIDSNLTGKPKAKKMWKLVDEDSEVNADWDMANYIAVKKLHYNDHGETHVKIAAMNALKMLSILLKRNILPDMLRDRGGDVDDEYLVVLSAALLHDIGNQIYRAEHNLHSAYLAIPVLNRLLPQIYENVEHWVELRGFILNAIFTHDAEVRDLTFEGALVGIADGTDMTKGRGRTPFEMGDANIHSISALSIDDVKIFEGDKKPIRIEIVMSNSAGIFQVQQVLGEKIRGSPMEDCVEIVAYTLPEKPKVDRRIISRIRFERGKYLVE